MLAVYSISFLMVREKIFPLSINSMMSSLNHLVRHWHVLVVGLLPVYVALMIFGTAVIGVYLGGALHRWFENFFKK